jgi:hypothetical protein
MTTDISREELLAHMGYVRDDVRRVRGDEGAAVVSVDKIGERTAANDGRDRAAAGTASRRRDGASARRRTSADAVVVALLGATLGAALIEWVKAHLLTGAAAK